MRGNPIYCLIELHINLNVHVGMDRSVTDSLESLLATVATRKASTVTNEGLYVFAYLTPDELEQYLVMLKSIGVDYKKAPCLDRWEYCRYTISTDPLRVMNMFIFFELL